MLKKMKYYIIAAIIVWMMGFAITISSLYRSQIEEVQKPQSQIMYQQMEDDVDYDGDVEDLSPEELAHV